MVHWGTRECSTATSKRFRPLPRKPITVRCGEPVDLSAYRGRPVDAALLREVTDLIMGRVRDLLAEVRGEPAPQEFYRRESGVTGEIRRVAVLGAGSWGTTFAKVLADAGREVGSGRAGPRSPRRSTTRHAQPRLPARRRPARAADGDHRRRRARSTAPTPWCSPCRRRRCGPTSTGWRDLLPPGRDAGQPGQGRRAGHAASG